ncbi:hypothetical protein [Rhodoplanes azumiensis]|uniref:Uncharacterized protein n=1 Tax=Rhodoplanes azumiensis TaxID=1897628 RepID=A0ABW5APA1_9BRAD
MIRSRVHQVLLTGAVVGAVTVVTLSTGALASAADPASAGAARADTVVQAQAPAVPEPSVRPVAPSTPPVAGAPATPSHTAATPPGKPPVVRTPAGQPRPQRVVRAVAPRPAPRSPWMVASRLERAWFPVYIGIGW